MGRHAPKIFGFVLVVVLAFELVVGATFGKRWVLPAAAGLLALMLAGAFSAGPIFLWMDRRRRASSKSDRPK